MAHDGTVAGAYTAQDLYLSAACLLHGCLQDFCPCESQCTNQMFTRKQYAKVAVVSGSCCDGRQGLPERATSCSCSVAHTAGSTSPAVHGLQPIGLVALVL